MLYYEGQGVPKGYVLASMWLTLAAAQDATFAEARDFMEKGLTSQQFAEAQRLVGECKATGK